MSDEQVSGVEVETGAIVPAQETKPAKPVKQKDLTPEEEQVLATQFAMCEKGQRFLLLRAFEGNAHKAYNKRTKGGSGKVGNFEEYCQNVLGLTYDASYLSRLVSAAKVERKIAGESFNTLKLLSDGEEANAIVFKPRLTVKAAEQIGSLPEDKWQAVYEEALGVPGEHTPKEVAENLRKITRREYLLIHPEAAKKKDKAPKVGKRTSEAEPITTSTAGVEGLTDAPKRNLTPVTGASYEGSPEQQYIENGGTAAEWAAQHTQTTPEGVAATPDAYQAVVDENRVLRSFLKTFLDIMSSDTMDVAGLHTLYNDGTEWAQAHSL